MKCLRCQHENPLRAKFCLECGARLALACGKCHSELPTDAKFCLECGEPVAAQASASRFATPEAYTPKHLADKILISKSALEGERKQVTILFADLKGSMELLADRDPEEARKLLDPVLELMMEAVHRFEGTVNQVMGDGIMALFGAPLAHEDHAVRACYAALRMQDAVKGYAEGVRREEGITIRIRVGLNSGEVVVRAIGSDLHMDYTAVGQTTHLAARIEQLADPGTILLTPATLALCEDFVQVRALGPMRVKGLSESVEVYELAGANPLRSRFQAHAARGLTKFVGRASELTQLGEALELARGGRGQVAAVVGEPGVGKSRLFWELAHSHRTHDCLVLEAPSVSYGKATPYAPVIDLLRGYFQIELRDDARRMRERITGKLLALDRALEPALPALLALLDVATNDEAWTRLDPPQRRHRTLDAVKRLLLRESQVQPVIAIFEDLHWIDGETQAMLDGLADSLATARLLLLVNYRPEYRHSWGGKTSYRQLRLDALAAASAEELLEALLGADASLAPLRRLLIERTEGNPFFLEESVRTLVEQGMLVGAPRTYRLTRAPAALQIPATAQAIVAARIDRLAPPDKRLLQAASVIGKDVPLALLEAIGEMPESALRESLSRLQAAEFLYETSLFPEAEYTFKHALTHEVTYGSVLQERRRGLHAQIVDAIESLYGDRLVERVERLAHHAWHGTVWNKAVTYLRQSGAKATDRSAFRETVSSLEQALRALDRLPKSREMQELGYDIRRELLDPHLMLGQLDRRIEDVHEMKELAEVLGDTSRLARALAWTCNALNHLGQTEEAVQIGRRSVELASALDDRTSEIIARSHLGQAQFNSGAYEEAADNLRWSIATLRVEWDRTRLGYGSFPSVLYRHFLVECLTELGEFDEASAISDEAVRASEALDNPWSRALAYFAMAMVAVQRGDPLRAVAVAAQGLDLCDTYDMTFLWPRLASLNGYAMALSGQYEHGIALMERALQASLAMRLGQEETLRRAHASEGYLLAGRIHEARDTALGALEFAKQHGQHGFGARAHRNLGDIARLHPSLLRDSAEHHYREALRRADERGMRPLVAHCHLGLGRLYRRSGNRGQAQEHLTIATAMYREMDMTYWREQAAAELRQDE
jgi:class 3 adenylate cyclase/tetratricopeptide (TPR) repeat protein/ribosomal protein L40E